MRELGREALQVVPLVLHATAEPPVDGGAPVGEEDRSRRVEVPGQEPGERRRDVPRPRGEVEDGCALVLQAEALVEHGHAGGGRARVLVEHERVPRGEERPGERGDHDGVVDVAEDPGAHVVAHDEDGRLDGLGSLGPDADGVPAARQARLDDLVDDAAAVRPHVVLGPVDLDDDVDVGERDAGEAAPAADDLVAGQRALALRVGEEDTAEDTDPAHGSVAGVGDDGGLQPALAGTALADLVDAVLDARRPVQHGCGGR